MLELVRVVPVRVSEGQYERLKRICDKTGLTLIVISGDYIQKSTTSATISTRSPEK